MSFVFKNDELGIKNAEFCMENDEFCIKIAPESRPYCTAGRPKHVYEICKQNMNSGFKTMNSGLIRMNSVLKLLNSVLKLQTRAVSQPHSAT